MLRGNKNVFPKRPGVGIKNIIPLLMFIVKQKFIENIFLRSY